MIRSALTVLLALLAAAPARAETEPLAAWHGTWRGTCRIAPAYQGTSQFGIELVVQPHGLAGRYTWRLTYEASGEMPESVRNYEMRAVDAASGHYVLDEKNGLLLDSYAAGRALYTHFAIGDQVIPGLYLLLSDTEMLLDLPAFRRRDTRRTCLTGNAETCVEAFRLAQSQRCRLTRTRR